MSIFLPVGLSDRQYISMSPHSRAQSPDFTLTLAVRARLCEIYRNGPRSATFRKYKYSPGMIWISPVLSVIYRSLTPSHPLDTADEHSQKEQNRTSWDPRHDPIAALVSRSL